MPEVQKAKPIINDDQWSAFGEITRFIEEHIHLSSEEKKKKEQDDFVKFMAH